MGVSFIIGVGIALLIMPISKYIMGKIIRFHRKLMKQKDARVKVSKADLKILKNIVL